MEIGARPTYNFRAPVHEVHRLKEAAQGDIVLISTTRSDDRKGQKVTEQETKERADQRFEAALEKTGARDPRDFYRERLKELRGRDAAAFRRAVDYYETHLIPAVAQEDTDPLAEWLEYGRVLAELSAPGRTLQIDTTGRAHDYAPPVPLDHLVLHLPTAAREPALVVGLPSELSTAQRATYDLLVTGLQG